MQHEWLTQRFSQFLDHQAHKTLGKFFPRVYEDYLEKWPPTPTEEDISEAKGNIAVATASTRQTEETVRDFGSEMLISR